MLMLGSLIIAKTSLETCVIRIWYNVFLSEGHTSRLLQKPMYLSRFQNSTETVLYVDY